jgi:type I restriction enzyme, S subunit
MQYSLILKSQLEGATRVDAEYYQSEYLDMFEKVNNFKVDNIGNVCDILRGNTPKEYGDFEIPVVRSGDLSYGFIDDDENLLKAKKDNIFYLKNGDVLISSIGFGSIGKVNIFFGEDDKLATVAEVSVLRDCKINPFFVWGFLKSKFGQFQIDREITGATGQLHLNTGNVANIMIPLVKDKVEQEIEYYFKDAEKLYVESKELYNKAEILLLEELGLKDFKEDKVLFSIVNSTDVENANRIDAEYFQEKYKKLVKSIKLNNAKKLGDLVSIKKGFEPGSEEYYEEGKLFIRVSSLSVNGINLTDEKYLSEKLYNELKDNYQPKVGEILLTKDATPGISYAVKEPVEGIMSGGILRLKIKENINAEYLTLCLNSVIGKMQAERDSGGSVIAHWRPEQIKNIIIPILPKKIQEKIADLVRQSHEARKKAKELLEEAKLKVEEMIESKG